MKKSLRDVIVFGEVLSPALIAIGISIIDTNNSLGLAPIIGIFLTIILIVIGFFIELYVKHTEKDADYTVKTMGILAAISSCFVLFGLLSISFFS